MATRITKLIHHIVAAPTSDVAVAEAVDLTTTVHNMVINGKLVKSSDGKVDPVINPATGEVFTTVPSASAEDLDQAVAAAKSAFKTWKNEPYEVRQACLLKFADLLEARAQEFAKALTSEQGKPLNMALGEVMSTIKKARSLAKIGNLTPDVTHEDDNCRYEIHYIPRGVIGGITPWNFPLSMAANKIFPSTITGNTCVIKPSPYTPLSTVMMSEIAAEAFPPGVVNILSGPDALGQQIVEHPDIAHITFTGSAATGKKIMATGSATLKKVTLELGGNDPAIILPGTDIKKVAPQVFGKAMFNTGQVCVAIKRVFVHEDQYEEMTQELAKAANGARFGDGMDPMTEYGPINNQMQFNRVAELVDDAKANGARVIAGGEAMKTEGGGYFYKPTILADVAEGVRVIDEEQFGPVIPVMKYKTVEEAVARANDTDFGLGGSVWGADPEEANRVATTVDSGSVWVNDHLANHESAPFGGIKQSGIGNEGGGTIGLKEFVDMKTMKMAK